MEKILIVDDEPDTLILLERILEKEGYKVIKAHNGKEALEKLGEKGADLVVLDIMMPEMDGYDVCKRIKTNPKTSHIPVIFLSVRSSDIDIIKGLEYKAEDYITKPFNKQILTAKIKAVLRRKGKVEEIKEKVEEKESIHGNLRLIMLKNNEDFYNVVGDALSGGKNLIISASFPRIFFIINRTNENFGRRIKFFCLTFDENEELTKKNIKNNEIVEVPTLDELIYLFETVKEGSAAVIALEEIIGVMGFSQTLKGLLKLSEKAVFRGIELTFTIREGILKPEQKAILESLIPGAQS